MSTLLLLIIIFTLYIIYSVTRMFIDPDYRDRMEKEAYRYRNRHRRPHHIDPDDTDMFGNYIHPRLHEKKQRREFNKWMRSIK